MSDSPRNHRKPTGVIFCAYFTFAMVVSAGTYSGGSGTAEDPYRISTVADWQELIAASDDWDKQFILLNDIDFEGIHLSPITSAVEIFLSGYEGIPFTGTFEGNGHILSNLIIDESDKDSVGLFRVLDSGGEIRNLAMDNATIAGQNFVGTLVGSNWGTITACSATGSVTGYQGVGGLTGMNHGTVYSCHTTSQTSGFGSYIGGLVGVNWEGTITGCYATGVVGGAYVGGLVGDNEGTISNCRARGAVNGSWCVGGLAGVNGGTITDCFATGIVGGTDDSVGGLVAENYNTIRSCYATGTVGGTGNDVGGLVGKNGDRITACYATGTVSGTGDGIGGLVGNNWGGTIEACYAVGSVSDTRKNVGGLVGMKNIGTVAACFWDMQTTGQTVSSGGIGMTTAQMKTLSYYKFAGWADKGWVMQNGVDYPRLSWENTEGIAIPPAGFSCAGSGTPEDPYQLSTVTDWQDLIANTDGWDSKYYILINDIDFGGIDLFPIAPATLPEPWDIQDQPFTGSFDGNGHILSNFKISGTGDDGVGLFGYLYWGQILNLCLENATLNGRGKCTGGLVAYMDHGWITACSFSGTVIGSGDNDIEYIDGSGPGDCVGGLVGINREGTITACNTTGAVSGNDRVGGLVGTNWGGTITACSSVCTVSGVEGIGGLAGGNWEGTISDCFATGAVSGHSVVGGLVGGHSEASIAACYATGTVNGNDGVGGLAGINNLGTITDCYATGTIRGNSGVGGLVGGNAQASIAACYATGTINASEKAGGLVGWNSGTITDSYTTCGINSSECFYGGVGGLCGDNSGTLSNCSTSGIISSTGNYVGGLAGKNRGGMITNCYTTGSTNGYYYVGGLVGKIESGSITSCSATGIVNGARDYVGGLIGYNDEGIITACYARGPVSGSGEVGGLVGYSYLGRITDCYANGTVSCKYYVGGLVGGNWDSVINTCYATGAVSGSGTYVGGLVGWNHLRTVTDCFWDMQTTGQDNSDGGKGLTTEQMKTLSIFQNAGWSGTYWIIQEGVDYPRLNWENTEGTSIPAAVIPFAGSGTAEDPYRISTADEFALLSWYSGILDKHILLTTDVDLSGISLCPIGDFHGCSFAGLFDGGGHTLSNGGIHQPESEGIGLFGRVGPGGQIRNLGVENVNITGYQFVGALVGWNEGTIRTCSITGAIEGYDNNVGGLIGHNEGTITSCDFTGVVKGIGYYSSSIGGLVGRNQGGTITASHATGMVSGNSNVGGLVGVHSGTITGNYSSSTVNGSGNFVGGLVGTNGDFSTITACYATGTVSRGSGLVGENRGGINACYATGAVSVGNGLVGYNNDERGTVTACFWDRETSGQMASAGGEGKTTTEMKTITTFTSAGWDFVGEAANGAADVWRMCADGVSYPRLSWEFSQGGDMSCPDGVAMEDLVYLAGRWMAGTAETIGAADTNGDGRTDMEDFAILSSHWIRQ